MTDSHAFLAPSAAHIWGPDGCAYYPTMAAAYPALEDTIEAREGSAAHHLLAMRLWGVVLELGDLAPNGEPITKEMVDCTTRMVADIEALRLAYPDLEECTEEKVYMPSVHPRLNWGTSDWFAISRKAKKIWLKDYKHGHSYVDAWENWQLSDYLLGVINHFQVNDYEKWTADLAIYQPRCYHDDGPVKTWELGGHRFKDLSAKLAAAAAEATSPNPRMHTGDHCTYCEGNIHCPAFRRSVEKGIDLSMRGAPEEMGPEAKGTLRTMVHIALARLKGMATGQDADIEANIRAGTTIPGWELKPTQTRLAWTCSVGEVHYLGAMMGVPLTTTEDAGGLTVVSGVLTPKQAIDAGIDEAVIMAYASRPPAGLKVVQSSTTSAAKAFS